jgi:hypothetical protein
MHLSSSGIDPEYQYHIALNILNLNVLNLIIQLDDLLSPFYRDYSSPSPSDLNVKYRPYDQASGQLQ